MGNIGFRYTLDPLRKWISSHLEAYTIHRDFKLIAGCDSNIDRLNEVKRYYPRLNLYASWEEMLSMEDLDILSICVSPEINYEISFSAAISKMKAVIFEKPFSRNAESGIKMIDNLKKTKLITAVNHFRRWQGSFLKTKELLDSGIVGSIRRIEGRYSTGLLNGGGVHLIDTIQYLVGNFTEVMALNRVRMVDTEDDAFSAYGRINSTEVFIAAFNKSDYNIFEIDIWGDKGKLSVDEFGTRISFQEATSSSRFSSQKELSEPEIFKADGLGSNFTNLLDNLVSVLDGENACRVLCGPEDAMQAIRVADGILESYNSKGLLINLEDRK